MRIFDTIRNHPQRITVRAAWLEHERYVGQRVITSGVIGRFDADTPDEYFVLDDGPHRIGLRGDPALTATFRAHLGQRVRVTGTLTFKPGVGIFLTAEDVRATRGGRKAERR